MQRVTGIGGVFFRARDPEMLYAWYEKHLGIKRDADGSGVSFKWTEGGMTVWSIFPDTTKYFKSDREFMINYRVADLDALAQTLRQEGVEVEGPVDEGYGKFAWITDPEGNRMELWEPK